MAIQGVSIIDTLIVVSAGILGAVVSEAFAWFFVYCTENYQSLLLDIKKTTQKLEQQKNAAPKSIRMNAKLKMQETQLNKKTQSLGFMRMKAGLFSSVFYFLIVPFFNRAYEGVVVAQLPFEPLFFFRSLAHHGLSAFEETDCSSVYLYILSIGFFATNLQKLVGSAPPKSTSSDNPFLGSLLGGADQNTVGRQ